MSGTERLGAADAVCLGAVLWAAGTAALSLSASVAHWDLNPLLVEAAESAMTPGQMLIACAVALLASAVLWARHGSGWSLPAWCWLVGGAGVLLHGLVLTPLAGGEDGAGADGPRGDLRSLVVGASWLAGVVSAWAIARHPRRAVVLRVVVGTLLTLCAVMAAKGLFERFVEYPRMLEAYRSDPASAQLMQGMEPGSRQAAMYERRLAGNRPTGWFGLSNVLASYMGLATILAAGLFHSARRVLRSGERSGGVVGVPALMAAGFGLVLVLTGSSAGIGLTLAVGCGALVAVWWGPVGRAVRRRPGPAVLAPSVAVLAMVVVRGMLGTGAAERSVLFRWHYWIGTTRVLTENWLLGAGPGGFQGAYTKLKPAISPENVQSAHALPADLVGAFGLLGVAWVVGIVVWALRRRPAGALAGPTKPDAEGRWELRLVAGVTAATVLCAGAVGWPVWSESPDLVLVVLVGWLAGLGLVWVMQRCGSAIDGVLEWATLAGAGLLLAHAMFDVTPAWAGSAMLFWVAVGAGLPVGPGRRVDGRWGNRVSAGVLGAMGVVVLWAGLVQATVVEASLAGASRSVRRGLEASGAADMAKALVEADLGLRRAIQRSVAASLEMESVHLQFRGSVEPVLEGAGGWGEVEPLVELGERLRERWDGSAVVQGRIALVFSRDGISQGARDLGVRAAVRAAELSPHDAGPAYRAWELLALAGRDGEAREWGRLAIVNHRQSRLDPLAGLTEEQQGRLRGFGLDAQEPVRR